MGQHTTKIPTPGSSCPSPAAGSHPQPVRQKHSEHLPRSRHSALYWGHSWTVESGGTRTDDPILTPHQLLDHRSTLKQDR